MLQKMRKVHYSTLWCLTVSNRPADQTSSNQYQYLPVSVTTSKNPKNQMQTALKLTRGTIYKFTRDDLAYCINIGSARYWNDKKAGIREQKYTNKRPGMDLDVYGFCGEYALAKMLQIDNHSLESDCTPQGIQDDRGDLVVDGIKIDTKCAIGHNCDMWVRKNSLRNPSDVYVLLTYESDNARKGALHDHDCTLSVDDPNFFICFQGACTGSEVFQPKNLVIDKYIVPRTNLTNLEDALNAHRLLGEQALNELRKFKKENCSFF